MKKYLLICLLLVTGREVFSAEGKAKAVLFPFREAVIASRVDSQTGKYHFRLGEAFPRHAVLTELDSTSYRIKFQQAKEQMDFAKAVYEDKIQLRKNKFTSDFEVKKAGYEFRTAQNNHAVAELNLSYCRIQAPFAGKIVEIMTREYETVRSGQALFRIIDDHSLLAVMNVPLEKVRPVGSVVTVLLQNAVRVQGKVYEISPQADHRTGTVRIRVLIDNRKGNLRAGMTGELSYGK